MPSKNTGRRWAQALYPTLGVCERCGERPATDRHHQNGDVFDNARSNVALLCRRCHMVVDGRLPFPQIAATRRRNQPYCVNGHPLSGDNLYVKPGGARQCRECARVNRARYRRP